VPVIVTLHEVQYDCKGIRQAVLCRLEKMVVKGASAVIAHTPLQAEFINRKYNTEKAISVYMGVKDTKRFAKKGKNLLFFGMINSGKGVEYLIGAMRHLPDYRLTVAGKAVSQAYAAKLRHAASGMKNVSMKISWVSENDKKKLLSHASIMVLPYVWAPYQSAVATDAVSYGIPIIVTKIGGTWELVKASGSGEVIEPRNPKQIAEAVKKIHSGYERYIKGIRKYRHAAKWKNIAAGTIKLYNRLLD
jgi:glycosyltransferase involved in cell wall biosynthesis